MHVLANVPTNVLMSELVRRTIANDDLNASPRSLLELSCTMASLLGRYDSLLFSEALRDAADQLEHVSLNA